MDEQIELGDKVEDSITGATGVVIGLTCWLYGCKRATIQPDKLKEGAPQDPFTIDVPQLKVLEKEVLKNAIKEKANDKDRNHGPREDAVRGHSVKR